MNSLGFFLCSLFYSFIIIIEYFFYPNNYSILLLIVSSLLLLIPLKLKFKRLIAIYLIILMSVVIKSSYNSLFEGNQKIISMLVLIITSIIISRIDFKGIIGIFSFFLCIILIIYIYILLSTMKIPTKPMFDIKYEMILIPIDLMILNLFRPKHISKYIPVVAMSLATLIIFIISILTFAHYGTYIYDFKSMSIMIFKLQYYFDEIGGYDFIYYYIIPVLVVFRIAINGSMINQLGLKGTLSILVATFLSFFNINVYIPIFVGTICILGGLYGNFRKIQK